MLVLKSRLDQNALERGIDPRGLCSICAQPFEGFDLQDDHVLPIGARTADEGLVLIRFDDEFSACLPSEASAGSEVFCQFLVLRLRTLNATCPKALHETSTGGGITAWPHWSSRSTNPESG